MKIGVISDTHLSTLTGDFITLAKDRLAACDMVVHAGDFTSPEIYFFLKELTSGNLIAVYGNMDPPEISSLLPEKVIFEAGGIKIGVMHGGGAPHDLEERVARAFFDEGVGCIIYGHSHNGANHTQNDILFFNPGSPTDRYHATMNSIGFLTIEHGEIFGEIVPV
jgi:putative phosphoesterase